MDNTKIVYNVKCRYLLVNNEKVYLNFQQYQLMNALAGGTIVPEPLLMRKLKCTKEALRLRVRRLKKLTGLTIVNKYKCGYCIYEDIYVDW